MESRSIARGRTGGGDICLLEDAEAGLLGTLGDQGRAEVFDDFLDRADCYAKNKRKEQVGTIACVVFEDSVRRFAARSAPSRRM